ncbi:TatD family hydrolase [Merdibacter massiliensis]|uniref:TatD family hydrolase n=1 Tax=Merdibacter massiliensis TaxID=1871030 RepID=UPI00096A4763|nr:TatD family hydrolase [Merdibacter massiliensis]
MIQYIDSHCHITCDRLYGRVEEILQNCRQNHVSQLLVVCCKREEFDRAWQLKQQYDFIKIAYGFYPCDTYELTEQDYEDLENLCKQNKIDVIGEIGLDYHYEDTVKEIQQQAFIRQIQLAVKYQLPFSVHMRDATLDGMTLIKKYAETPFVLHCFSGSIETAMEAIRLGGYISFAGPLTFKNARNLPAVAQSVPVERILTETDSPYLTPVPFRGKENEPMYVRYTFEKICECRNTDPAILSEQIKENYQNFIQMNDTILNK